MKKRILSFVLLTVLALSVVSPAYATEPWVLSPDTEQITHGDDIYYRIDYPYSSYIDPGLSWKSYELEFPNQKMAVTYADSYVYATSGVEDIAIEVQLVENRINYSSYIYVEEAYYDEYMAIKNGEPSEYIVSSFNSDITISRDELDAWHESDKVIIEWDEIYEYDYFYLFATDSSGAFRYEIGQVLKDLFADEFYLLMYDDYDESCFDDSNDFDLNALESATVYDLKDAELEEYLLDGNFTYHQIDLEEDFVYGDVAPAIASVFASVVFGVIPLAVVIFAAIMLIKVEDKKYNRGFVKMIIGASMVILAFVVVFIIAM